MAGESEIGAMVNVSEKSAKIIADIIRTLYLFLQKKKNEIKNRPTELKNGIISQNKLMDYAHKNHEKVITQDGISKKDIPDISKKAKEYGIAVAVTGKNDSQNIKITILESDKAVFEQIMTDILKERLQQNPNELVSFKVKPWEVEPLNAMFDKNGLSAYCVKDGNGDIHFVYDKDNKRAFDIAKNEFRKVHKEVSEGLEIKAEDDFTIIKDVQSGREISFDEVLTKDEITQMLQENFGYDEIKASLAANKYASGLSPEEQSIFLNDNPIYAADSIEHSIKIEDESILLNDLNFIHVKLKDDGVDCIVIMDNEGKALTITPDMDNTQINNLINTHLDITDNDTVEAIIDKVNTIKDVYQKDNKVNLSETISSRNGVNLGTCEIERLNRNQFEVNFKGNKHVYSFSDKKNVIESLRKEFYKAGQTEEASLKSARNVYKKAKAQSAVKFVREEPQVKTESVQNSEIRQPYRIERQVGGTFTVSNGEHTEKYDLKFKNNAVQKMQDDFGMSKGKAERIFSKAQKQNGVENEAKKNTGKQTKTAGAKTPGAKKPEVKTPKPKPPKRG